MIEITVLYVERTAADRWAMYHQTLTGEFVQFDDDLRCDSWRAAIESAAKQYPGALVIPIPAPRPEDRV